MAESKVEAPVCHRLKMYDENDELELFSVELMLNLMKYFNNANFVVMPKLPRPSKYYSITILKSVQLGWRITHSNFSRRFRKDFPDMCRSRRELFTYAVCQAAEFFDNMYSYAQLVYLAAYCYELSCFLSRNGLEEYIYVSYCLFSTVWKELYEAKFDSKGGWEYAEKALKPYAMVLKPLEDIFLPGYLFDFEDLMSVQVEYAIILHRCLDPGNKPIEEELRIIFGELEDRMRRRVVTMEDMELDYLEYVMNFKQLKFFDEIQVYAAPMRLMDYLAYRAIEEQRYKGLAVLREFVRSESGSESPSDSDSGSASYSEDSVNELEDDITDDFRRLLLSCSIHGAPNLLRPDDEDTSKRESVKDTDTEKEQPPPTAADTEAKREKSAVEGGETPQRGSPRSSATASDTKPEKSAEIESDDDIV